MYLVAVQGRAGLFRGEFPVLSEKPLPNLEIHRLKHPQLVDGRFGF